MATDGGCKVIVEESIKALGGLDVIVSNAVRSTGISHFIAEGYKVLICRDIGMDKNRTLRGPVCTY